MAQSAFRENVEIRCDHRNICSRTEKGGPKPFEHRHAGSIQIVPGDRGVSTHRLYLAHPKRDGESDESRCVVPLSLVSAGEFGQILFRCTPSPGVPSVPSSDHSIDELSANHAVHLWPVIQKLTRKRHAGDGGESCPRMTATGFVWSTSTELTSL